MLHRVLQMIKLMFIDYIASSTISFFNCSNFEYLQEHSLE